MARVPAPRIDPRDPLLGRIRDFLLWVKDTIDAVEAAIEDLQSGGGVSAHASTHIRGGPDQIDADKLDIDYSPVNYTSSTAVSLTTSTEELTSHLKGLDTAVGNALSAANTHASRHIRGGADELDGDLVDIDFVPTTYTRTVTSPATNEEHLTAHLSGLDIAVGAVTKPDFATYFSPIGAWLLDSTRTTDLSGNGRTLTATGTMRLGPSFVSGLASTYIDNSSFLTSTDSAFNLLGAVTIEAVVNPAVFTGGGIMAAWAGNGSTEALNITWTLGRAASTGILGGTVWERAAGIVVSLSELGRLPTGEWLHFVQTRASDGVTLRTYMNGTLISTGVASNAPTGGTSGRLSIGGTDTTAYGFWGQYLAIYGSELSGADVLTLARRRMAPRRT